MNLTGTRLEAGGGGSYSHVRTVPVINLGGGTLHWEAAVISGGEWLQVTPERGTATAEQFGRLLLQAEPSDLSPGVYNALIRVTDQSDGTTPQYVTAALKIGDPDAALSPEPSPAGLFFVGNAGGSEVAPQPILLLAATTAPVAFQASASTADGGDWLRVEPRTGFTSMHDPQALRVIVDPKRLSSGIYTGDVTVAFANRSIRSTNITLVAPGSTEAAKASQRQQQSVSCVPSSLALTHTGTVNSFAIPAGWPTPVVIRLADNCGGAVSEASMVATFSNGDPPLAMRLTNPRLGIYSATWIPRRGHQRVAATARATSPALGTATAVIIGGVEDEAAASMPLPSGVLSMSGPGLGSVIALGAPVQIFGSNLAKSARAAMSMPLPLLLDDTSVVVGGREAPLFFVSESQINAQIPFELAADKEHAVVVMSAGGFTVAEPLVLATTRPILLTVGTRVLAQRADGVMVTPEAPVEPGERITFFLTGMGHTVPAVASGELPAPSVVPVVRIAPRVTIGGEPAVVHSTELAPDAVGVYRMQVTIPSETAPGLATVQVEQNGVNSNGAELPVR